MRRMTLVLLSGVLWLQFTSQKALAVLTACPPPMSYKGSQKFRCVTIDGAGTFISNIDCLCSFSAKAECPSGLESRGSCRFLDASNTLTSSTALPASTTSNKVRCTDNGIKELCDQACMDAVDPSKHKPAQRLWVECQKGKEK